MPTGDYILVDRSTATATAAARGTIINEHSVYLRANGWRQQHPGNIYFSNLLKSESKEYAKLKDCLQLYKTSFVDLRYQHIINNGGQFFSFNEVSKEWDVASKSKVCKVIRQRLQPSYYNKKKKPQTTITPQITKLSRVPISTATTTTARRASTRIMLRQQQQSKQQQTNKSDLVLNNNASGVVDTSPPLLKRCTRSNADHHSLPPRRIQNRGAVNINIPSTPTSQNKNNKRVAEELAPRRSKRRRINVTLNQNSIYAYNDIPVHTQSLTKPHKQQCSKPAKVSPSTQLSSKSHTPSFRINSNSRSRRRRGGTIFEQISYDIEQYNIQHDDKLALSDNNGCKTRIRNASARSFLYTLTQSIQNNKLVMKDINEDSFLYTKILPEDPQDRVVHSTTISVMDYRIWSWNFNMPDHLPESTRNNIIYAARDESKDLVINIHTNIDKLMATMIPIAIVPGTTKDLDRNNNGTRIMYWTVNKDDKPIKKLWNSKNSVLINPHEVPPQTLYCSGNLLSNTQKKDLWMATDTKSQKMVIIDSTGALSSNKSIKNKIIYAVVGDYLDKIEVQNRIDLAIQYNMGILPAMLILAIRKAHKMNEIDMAKEKEQTINNNNLQNASFNQVSHDIRILFLRLREIITCQSHKLSVSMLNRFAWIHWHYLKTDSDILYDDVEKKRRVESRQDLNNHLNNRLSATVNKKSYKVKVSCPSDDVQMVYHTAAIIIPSGQTKDTITWPLYQKICYKLPTVQSFMQLTHGRTFREFFDIVCGAFNSAGKNSSTAAALLQMFFELASMGKLDNNHLEYFYLIRSKKANLIGNERDSTQKCMGVPSDAHVMRLIISNFAERAGISVKEGQTSVWTPTQKEFANSICRTSMDDVIWLINDICGQISQWLAENNGSGYDFAICVLKTLVSVYPSEYDDLVDKWVKEDGWSKSQRDD